MTFMEKVQLFNTIMQPIVDLTSFGFGIWAIWFSIKTFRE